MEKKNIIVPFRYGKGKTGNAKTGQERAIVTETVYYSNAFNDLRGAIKDAVKHFSNYEEAVKKSIHFLLNDGVKDKNSHVIQWVFGDYNIMMVNMNLLQATSGPNRLQSITVDNQIIYI